MSVSENYELLRGDLADVQVQTQRHVESLSLVACVDIKKIINNQNPLMLQ